MNSIRRMVLWLNCPVSLVPDLQLELSVPVVEVQNISHWRDDIATAEHAIDPLDNYYDHSALEWSSPSDGEHGEATPCTSPPTDSSESESDPEEPVIPAWMIIEDPDDLYGHTVPDS